MFDQCLLRSALEKMQGAEETLYIQQQHKAKKKGKVLYGHVYIGRKYTDCSINI